MDTAAQETRAAAGSVCLCEPAEGRSQVTGTAAGSVCLCGPSEGRSQVTGQVHLSKVTCGDRQVRTDVHIVPYLNQACFSLKYFASSKEHLLKAQLDIKY